MAKEPGLELKGEKTGDICKVFWEDVIHKHVRAVDNVDIGDVDRVGNEFIVVREGVANVHMFIIFQSSILLIMMEAPFGLMYQWISKR